MFRRWRTPIHLAIIVSGCVSCGDPNDPWCEQPLESALFMRPNSEEYDAIFLPIDDVIQSTDVVMDLGFWPTLNVFVDVELWSRLRFEHRQMLAEKLSYCANVGIVRIRNPYSGKIYAKYNAILGYEALE